MHPSPATDYLDLRSRMMPELPDHMAAHIDRVVVLAMALARRHGADESRAALMAQAHDLVRAWKRQDWLAAAEQHGLELLPLERAEPVMLHGPIGALLLEERGLVVDIEVLDAVRYHTTGHPAYSVEAWAMFVADKVEPDKLRRRPALQVVAEAAERSLEAGALAYLDLMARDEEYGARVSHPLAEETRGWLREWVGRR